MAAERWILAIADDLTGALETGAKFASRGLTSRVTTEPGLTARPEVDVLVVDTETRHLPGGEAADVVRGLAAAAVEFTPWLIYKKTDSTLRGNIAAELRALQQVMPDRELIYAPAYPEMGRTVKEGRLLVHGVPVHQTAFARDPLNPVVHSDITKLLGDVPAVLVDGESSDDVRSAARRIVSAERPFAAGPASLAGALAEGISGCRGEAGRTWPRIPRCLVVNGSLHPASGQQVQGADAAGCFAEGWRCFSGVLSGTGLERAQETGEQVRRMLAESPVDALIVFGGDTAFAIHRALGAGGFEPYGEIVPGVPLSSCNGLLWITKAGGFGESDLLCEIRRLTR